MYRIAVCDDSKLFLALFCQNLSKWIKKQALNVNLQIFETGDDLLYSIEENGHFQIIFLDIELEKTNGLTIADRIISQCAATMIIFMSAYDQYFKAAYRVHPFYFFAKPIEYAELSAVMNRAFKRLDTNNQDFCFYRKTIYYSLPIREIVCFFSEGRKIGIISTQKTDYFYGKLDRIEELMKNMSDVFLRIHQSYLINKRHIGVYHYDFLEVTGAINLPISRIKRKAVREALHNDWVNSSIS